MLKSIKMKFLLCRIKVKRLTMYKKASIYGLTHPCVVKCSRKLDHLLNKAQGIYS